MLKAINTKDIVIFSEVDEPYVWIGIKTDSREQALPYYEDACEWADRHGEETGEYIEPGIIREDLDGTWGMATGTHFNLMCEGPRAAMSALQYLLNLCKD